MLRRRRSFTINTNTRRTHLRSWNEAPLVSSQTQPFLIASEGLKALKVASHSRPASVRTTMKTIKANRPQQMWNIKITIGYKEGHEVVVLWQGRQHRGMTSGAVNHKVNNGQTPTWLHSNQSMFFSIKHFIRNLSDRRLMVRPTAGEKTLCCIVPIWPGSPSKNAAAKLSSAQLILWDVYYF